MKKRILIAIFLLCSSQLFSTEKYADAGFGFAYTPSLVAREHEMDGGDKTTFQYGSVMTLSGSIGTGFFYPGDLLEKFGVFIEYDYSFMNESNFRSVFVGPEIKFFYYIKAAFGIGNTNFSQEIPVDRNNKEIEVDYSTKVDMTASIGLEFNLPGDFILGCGIKTLTDGGSGNTYYLDAKYNTLYFEISRNLF